jgi:hypothetical protein
MENTEFYNIFLELGLEVFKDKIEKTLELYSHSKENSL